MEVLTIRFQKNVLDTMDKRIALNNFNSRTEFIREAVRTKISELEKEEALKKLAHMKGIMKNKSKKNDKEAGNLAMKKLLKKFNI